MKFRLAGSTVTAKIAGPLLLSITVCQSCSVKVLVSSAFTESSALALDARKSPRQRNSTDVRRMHDTFLSRLSKELSATATGDSRSKYAADAVCAGAVVVLESWLPFIVPGSSGRRHEPWG
jgi:hypothetical protein